MVLVDEIVQRRDESFDITKSRKFNEHEDKRAVEGHPAKHPPAAVFPSSAYAQISSALMFMLNSVPRSPLIRALNSSFLDSKLSRTANSIMGD